MLVYPQLESGALSQYPVVKTRRTRTVINRASDGSSIRLADAAGQTTEWLLTYSDLSDDEASALRALFDAAEGTLQSFTFVDPAGNLLAWSEQLDDEVWQQDPLLTASDGGADPRGGTAAWLLSNAGACDQGIAQTLAAPGDYQYCFSAYVRSATSASVMMSIAGRVVTRAVMGEWTRVSVTGTGASAGHLGAIRDRVGAGRGG